MSELTYTVRRSLASASEDFALTATGLNWPGGSASYGEIKSVRVYSLPGLQMLGVGRVAAPMRRCTVLLKNGSAISLTSQHYLSVGKLEDRSATLRPFMRALVEEVRKANPNAALWFGMPRLLWWFWFVTFGGLSVGLAAIVLLALIGLISQHNLSFAMSAFLLALAVLLVGPATFLRAVWQRRSRPLRDSEL